MERLLEEARKTLDGGWRSALNFAVQERLPNRRRALLLLNKLRERLGAEPPDYLKGDFLLHLTKLFSYSAFLGEFLVSHPEVLPELESTYTRTFKPADFKVQPGREEADVLRNLRVYRHTQMARVVLRDILNLAPFTELTRDVTLIHDACIREALKFAQEKMRERYGEPSCGFLVVAMGKAGGFELNYSSDVDMMFVYDSRYGETAGGKYGKLQNHDYFTILSKYITELLSKPTAEGRCMVVDLRLRPNGSLGPLCNDLEALEQYYTAVAMPWERFALLKARPCAGDVKKTGLEFLKLVRALIFRKYIDLTLVEELLRIKELIKSKVAKKGRKVDVKLGEGGIREVEFIVQAFQLMYGGRFPDIRSTNTLSALQKLRRWGFLNEKEWQELKDAYILLRRTEHMLQITNFRQTQTFHPESEEAQELAVKLGFPSRAEFLRKLRETMETVNLYFGRFFPTGDRKTLSSVGTEELARMGFKEPEAVKRLLNALLSTKSLSPGEANRLDVMGDELLRTLLTAPEPQTTLKNLISLLETREGKLLLFSLRSLLLS
jgi:glutamate-ammonia-ligase adenylyltransferase